MNDIRLFDINDMVLFGGVAVGLFITMYIGYKIGGARGNKEGGAALGLLGPLGWLIAALIDMRLRCPFCGSRIITPTATVCARCTRELPKVAEHKPAQ